MLWSILLYLALLTFALAMISRLAPKAVVTELPATSDRLRCEFAPTRLPATERIALDEMLVEA